MQVCGFASMSGSAFATIAAKPDSNAGTRSTSFSAPVPLQCRPCSALRSEGLQEVRQPGSQGYNVPLAENRSCRARCRAHTGPELLSREAQQVPSCQTIALTSSDALKQQIPGSPFQSSGTFLTSSTGKIGCQHFQQLKTVAIYHLAEMAIVSGKKDGLEGLL